LAIALGLPLHKGKEKAQTCVIADSVTLGFLLLLRQQIEDAVQSAVVIENSWLWWRCCFHFLVSASVSCHHRTSQGRKSGPTQNS